jgi:hypothetical protein
MRGLDACPDFGEAVRLAVIEDYGICDHEEATFALSQRKIKPAGVRIRFYEFGIYSGDLDGSVSVERTKHSSHSTNCALRSSRSLVAYAVVAAKDSSDMKQEAQKEHDGMY